MAARLARTGRLLLLALLCGCAELRHADSSGERAFRFEEDRFAFANELVWIYERAAGDRRAVRWRSPPSDYTHRCFVLARSALQFLQAARFDPSLPAADDATYRELVRRVVRTDPRRPPPPGERVTIPGYASLYELSRARERLLKEELGGAAWSYLQRGHWRLVIPFPRGDQEDAAGRLMRALDLRRPPILHLVRFPRLSINHAVLLYDYQADEREVRFATYDPNEPDAPRTLVFDRASRTFLLPPNSYFEGGRVDVYEVYHRPWY
jgi:hypothetical protein